MPKKIEIESAVGDEIINLYQAHDLSLRRIGYRFGLSAEVVRSFLVSQRIEIRKYSNREKQVDDTTVSAIVELYTGGKSIRAIGAEVGLDKERVRDLLHEQGVETRQVASDTPKMATCHPGKMAVVKGLCSTCYAQEYRAKNERRSAPCHPDKKIFAGGVCHKCWAAIPKKESKGAEPFIYCPRCGNNAFLRQSTGLHMCFKCRWEGEECRIKSS
jgi:hypothetical protein